MKMESDPFQNVSPALSELLRGKTPSGCFSQARALLGMCHQGLRDMEGSDPDRVRLGFCGLVVFGRSVTIAMQHLRSFKDVGFDDWYSPWEAEMRSDPLLKFFSELRTEILKGGVPRVGVLLSVYGRENLRPGSVSVQKPLPASHRGKPLTDRSMETLCKLYIDYLEEMLDSLAPLVWPAEDRWLAAWRARHQRTRPPTQSGEA